MKHLTTRLLILAVTFLIGSAAHAQSFTVSCQSEDDGDLTGIVPAEYNSETGDTFAQGIVGLMPGSGAKVSLYASLARGAHILDVEMIHVKFRLTSGELLESSVRSILIGNNSFFTLSVKGPKIDPEGIDCLITPNLP